MPQVEAASTGAFDRAGRCRVWRGDAGPDRALAGAGHAGPGAGGVAADAVGAEAARALGGRRARRCRSACPGASMPTSAGRSTGASDGAPSEGAPSPGGDSGRSSVPASMTRFSPPPPQPAIHATTPRSRRVCGAGLDAPRPPRARGANPPFPKRISRSFMARRKIASTSFRGETAELFTSRIGCSMTGRVCARRTFGHSIFDDYRRPARPRRPRSCRGRCCAAGVYRRLPAVSVSSDQSWRA